MECTIGGTRRHLVDVARGQLAAGLEVHVIASTLRDPDFPADLDALEAEGVHVVRLNMVREMRPFTDLRHDKIVRHHLKRIQPDVVHTHSSKGGVLGRKASLDTGIGARVHTPHTFAFLFSALFGPLKRRIVRSIESYYGARTHRTVAVSMSEATTIQRSGVVPADRVRVVSNGIDPTPFENAESIDWTTLGVDPARPIALLVGLVYAAKGHDLAIESLAHEGLQDVQLVCAGPGDSAEYEALALERGVSDRVHFLGARRDVPQLLAGADLLFLPSRWEGMPYVVLEAMAASRPIVATAVDGARDLIVDGETGALALEPSIDDVAHALRRVVNLPKDERLAMGRASRARLEGRASIASMVDGLSIVYAEALEEARRETESA
tara:strand:- start:857 stop:1999 length:1143 start_codon:yes stop_codon:yes gene_type:complete